MAKNQTNYATNAANTLLNQAQGTTQNLQNSLGVQSGTAQQNQANELSSATTGFQNQQTTGGYDPTQLGTLRANTSNLASTGGYDPTQLGTLQGQMQNATSTGGYDPNALNNVNSLANATATTGGYDPTVLGTINTGYTNLATNGGFTPAQAQGFVRQATSGVTGTYDILAQQAAQDRAKTGGLGTGGEISQMARQLGQAQSTATLNAENQLNQLQTQNTISGLSGLGTSQANIAASKQAGLNTLSNTAASEAAGTLQGLGQQSQLQSNVAGAKSSGVAQQIGLEGSVAAGSNAANTGLAGLYNTTTNQVTQLGQQVLQALGLNFSTQEGAINALTGLSKNPGLFQTVLGDLTSAGGAAAGAAGALGVGV